MFKETQHHSKVHRSVWERLGTHLKKFRGGKVQGELRTALWRRLPSSWTLDEGQGGFRQREMGREGV